MRNKSNKLNDVFASFAIILRKVVFDFSQTQCQVSPLCAPFYKSNKSLLDTNLYPHDFARMESSDIIMTHHTFYIKLYIT